MRASSHVVRKGVCPACRESGRSPGTFPATGHECLGELLQLPGGQPFETGPRESKGEGTPGELGGELGGLGARGRGSRRSWR